MQFVFGRQFGIGRADRVDRNRKAKSRRLQPSVDGLERRNLMSAGSITMSGSAVTVMPASSGKNTVTVSYLKTGSVVTGIDVNLNGTIDKQFAPGSVTMVFFNGSGAAGDDAFTNNTALLAVAYGGSHTNTFMAGSGMNEFVGGSGTNDFYAGSGYGIFLGGTGANTYHESGGPGIILKGRWLQHVRRPQPELARLLSGLEQGSLPVRFP